MVPRPRFRRLTPTVTVHVGADNIHFPRVSRADLGAENFLARTGGRRLGVQRAQFLVGLLERVRVHADRRAVAAHHAAALRAGCAPGRRAARLPRIGRKIVVFNPLGRVAVALQLRLNPINGGLVAISALPAVAELGKRLDCRLVFFEVQLRHQRLDRIRRGFRRLRRSRRLGDEQRAKTERCD